MSLSDRDYMYEPRQFRRARNFLQPGPGARTPWPTALKAVVWAAVLGILFIASRHVLEQRDATPFPSTGDVLWYSENQRPPFATLTLYAPPKSGKNFAVQLDDWNTGAPIALIPVRAGESSVTLMPLSRYRVTIATGNNWLGFAKLFGRSGQVREAVYPLEFYRRTNETMGHRITLESLHGNMEMKPAPGFFR